MCSYHSLSPRFPDRPSEGFPRAPWAPNAASAPAGHRAAPSRLPEQQARSSAKPPEDGPDVIDAGRSYRQGPVYGSAVPTAVLRAMGFVTHMDTLRLETPVLGRMAYLQAAADQHHQLQRRQLQRRQKAGQQQASNESLDPQLPLFDASFPADVSSADASSPPSAYQYVNVYSGREHLVERRPGTFIKSMQGIAEDLYRRIHKRLPPAQDPLADPPFRAFYDRVRRALQRASGPAVQDPGAQGSDTSLTEANVSGAEGDTLPRGSAPAAPTPSKRPAPSQSPQDEWLGPLLQRIGPAVPSANKLVRDRNGQRWQVSPALQAAPPAQTAQTTLAVRASGPAPTIPWHRPYLDPLQVAEALYAHRETLHEQFTHGWKATIREGRWTTHKPRHGRRSETSIASNGSDYPSFISVGRWRADEISRRHPDSAVTVPWIIADIDGPGLATSAEYARVLCHLLIKRGLDPAHLIVSYTGGRGFHVRIPHGALGCPIYQNTEAASALLTRFFDELCAGHPELRAAIDDTACRPTQMIRMIGSRRARGGRCIAMPGDTFLDLDPLVLFGHSDNTCYDGCTLPKPEEAPYVPGLKHLLLPKEHTTQSHPIHHSTTQLLQRLTSPSSLQLRNRADAQKKARAGSALHANSYCWKPYFSRPPPEAQSAADAPAGRSAGVIGRLMDPVREGQAWGEAVGRPYVGRNKACFIMGLYATSYPDAALQRVQALLMGRDGSGMPGGDGAALTGGPSSRWMRQIAAAPGAAADMPAGDVPVEAVVHAWNRLVCRPALPEREVRATLRSARKYTQSSPR